MASDTTFPFNSWVWVKQPDYPWWPAMVLDPAESGQELPEGCDLVLLCGPAAAATLAFASSADGEQVQPFRGAVNDATLVEEGRKDESCGAAIDEMIAAADSTTKNSYESSSSSSSNAAAQVAPAPENNADAAVNSEMLLAETEVAVLHVSDDKTEKTKKKKHKSEKEKKHKKEKSKKERRSRRRHRVRHDDASAGEASEEAAGSGSSSSSDNGDSEGDDDKEDSLFRRRNGTTSARQAAKRERYERQSHLEEYDLGAGTLDDYAPRYDPDYLYRKLRNARRPANTKALLTCAAALREAMGRCLNGTATAAELEEEVLRLLRPLTCVDVTVAQLQESGVGVAVGGLLRVFTLPVAQLAKAILNYWFHSLPENTQQQLSAETEVDRASMDTCASGSTGDGGEGTLGSIGVMLYDSFTNEEIDDAPPNAKVMKLCESIEEALLKHCSVDAQQLVLSVFSGEDSTGKSLRRLVLEGKVNADDVVQHADDLTTLVRSNQRRPPSIVTHTSNFSMNIGAGSGSPTSPNEVFSPNGEGATGSPTFGSPVGQATTSLYTCPQCGANDAYQSSYTVQAHDNMPDILRCKKCGSTWNVSDQ